MFFLATLMMHQAHEDDLRDNACYITWLSISEKSPLDPKTCS